MKGHQMTKKLLEIERKRQLTGDAKELIKRLQGLGFELESSRHEIDTYYSRPDVNFMQTVECLRIRQRDGFAEVTYKPATTIATHTKNDVIIKPETNLPIQPGNAAIAKQLLANLGMVQLVEVNKYRRSFQSPDFPQATVAIDEIKDAGTFVEVEVLSDDETSALAMISEIEVKLGLDSAEVVTRPYRDICMG
ncbi:class IV adenylate cyclase [Candidatus Saccharibacteria bacterium oral taxon 488]|nr:class IV adenylate cyclase [Candidatus Saccharibacteria bacterium oral taxon 488]